MPVTLTAAGIAGFIISIGIAVDANVLIFERVKEEMRSGKTIKDSVAAGFSRAWFSIRDSNISNFITAVILFWFGTSLIQGFALTLGLGVIVSLFSAIVTTRIFLGALSFIGEGKFARFLFSSGFSLTSQK
jgi:protein-export membrane protein SecD